LVRYVRRFNLSSARESAGYRILDVEGPKIEASITQNGTLKGGTEAIDIVTYWSIPQPGGLMARRRILVVDDNPDITTTIKIGLEDSGLFHVDTFNDPKLALSSFRSGLYDLILFRL
jgi:PleD family two-component response regulator